MLLTITILLALLLVVLLRLNSWVIKLINVTQDLRDGFFAVHDLEIARVEDPQYRSAGYRTIRRKMEPQLAPPRRQS
jgi:hypothetical protein